MDRLAFRPSDCLVGGSADCGFHPSRQKSDGAYGDPDGEIKPSVPDPFHRIYGKVSAGLHPLIWDGDRHFLCEPEELPQGRGTRFCQVGRRREAVQEIQR